MSTNFSDRVIDDSILNSIKKLLGLSVDYDAFDQDIAIYINTAIANLAHMGVGPSDGFSVTGPDETWQELLGSSGLGDLHSVKSYIHITVKKIFDPPGASNHLAALDAVLEEITWRISTRREEVKYDYVERLDWR